MDLPSKASVRDVYETIAESYAAARRQPWPEVLRFLDGVRAGARIVDVGCGHGRHLVPGAMRGHRVVGVDVSRRLLAIGRASASGKDWEPRVAWIEADATSLPFPSRAFDAAVAVAVLHHLPRGSERLAALREIRRVLVPDGVALLTVWDFDDPRFQEIREARRDLPPDVRGDVQVPWTLPDGRVVHRFYHLFQERELEALIIDSGLHMERFFRRSGNRYAVARRRG